MFFTSFIRLKWPTLPYVLLFFSSSASSSSSHPFFNHCTGTDERRRTWEDGVVGLGRQPGSGSRSVGSWTTAPIPAGVVGSWLAARFLVQRRRFLFAAPDLGQRRRFSDGIVGSLPAARGSSPALGLACNAGS